MEFVLVQRRVEMAERAPDRKTLKDAGIHRLYVVPGIP
jgi:hypothetical protein